MIAEAKANMKIIAVIPVYGRHALLKHTITRLYKKNKVHHVICVGEREDRKVCENNGAEFIKHPNVLGAKWNEGFKRAKRRNASHVLFVGSSDFICDDYLKVMLPLCPEHGMVGTKGFYMAHIEKSGTVRAGRWHGYTKDLGEPIGIGRLITASILDKMKWSPFDPKKQSGMDWCMYQNG